MKKIILLTLLLTNMLFASIKIEVTYTTLGKVAKKIGGDLVSVHVLASPKYDPHFIVPKPSLLSKLRRADLLIINGAGLEIGWLPSLIKSANNSKIQPGTKGFLDMSHFIDMLNIPQSVSRAFGDIHAQGNPHYTVDPYSVLIMARVIAKKLSSIDPENTQTYNENFKNFTKNWNDYLINYDNNMAECKDKKVIQYHMLYNYYLKRYGFVSYGNIEPLPGITPSSKHTMEIINLMKDKKIIKILQDVYHEKRTTKFIANKVGAKVEIVPHDVGAVDGSDTLEDFYNKIAIQLCN